MQRYYFFRMVKQFADDYFDANKAKIFVLSVSTLTFKKQKKSKGIQNYPFLYDFTLFVCSRQGNFAVR